MSDRHNVARFRANREAEAELARHLDAAARQLAEEGRLTPDAQALVDTCRDALAASAALGTRLAFGEAVSDSESRRVAVALHDALGRLLRTLGR